MRLLMSFWPLVAVWLLVAAPTEPVEKAVTSLKQNNLTEFCKDFAPTVTLKMPGKDDNVAKIQATTLVTNLFTRNGIMGVKVLHKIDSSADYRFVVLWLTCKDGSYRMSITMRGAAGSLAITDLSIEEERLN